MQVNYYNEISLQYNITKVKYSASLQIQKKVHLTREENWWVEVVSKGREYWRRKIIAKVTVVH